MNSIEMYTDGSCFGNPGPGGFGVILTDKKTKLVEEIWKGYKLTTNNRMEIQAAISGLEQCDPNSTVKIYSDSLYVVESMTEERVQKWERNDWYNKGKSVPNQDLWKQLLREVSKRNVTFKWVKGHSMSYLNAKCDMLAKKGSRNPHYHDSGYKPKKKGVK